jgi:hypothetical protein
MLACFHVQVQYAGQLQLQSLQRPKGKHNRLLKVVVQGLVLWPTPYTYIHITILNGGNHIHTDQPNIFGYLLKIWLKKGFQERYEKIMQDFV